MESMTCVMPMLMSESLDMTAYIFSICACHPTPEQESKLFVDLRFLGAEFSQIPAVNFPNSGSELKSRFAFGKSNFVFGIWQKAVSNLQLRKAVWMN